MANIKQTIDFKKNLLELVKVSDISDIWIVHSTSGDRDYYDIKYILNGYSGTSCEASARFWDDRIKPQKVLLKILKLMHNNPKGFETEYLVVFTDDILLSSELDLDDIEL